MNGILLIDKKEKMTSRDVVNKICKIYGTKKVGHTGTLDPLATGLLVVTIGTYTKLNELLTSQDKEYIATMILGIETDTLDITGNVLKKENVKVTKKEIKNIFECFPKKYEQTVPKYSAIKVNGKRLYEYARENKDVSLPKRTIEIKDLELLQINHLEITFRAHVSKGTYIRSLVRDLALSLNTVGTMSKLRRTKQGIFKIEDAHLLDNITKDTPLLSVADVFNYPRVEVTENDYKKVLNGNPLFLNREEDNVFITYQNNIIAIYEKKDKEYRISFSLIKNQN